jgi:hypothetical protein
MVGYGETVSLEVEPEVLAGQPPDPELEHPATRWARRHLKALVFAGIGALLLVTGLLVRELTKPSPVVPSVAPPVVTVRVEGDVVMTTGHASFASGGVTDLLTGSVTDMLAADRPAGVLNYVSTSPAGETVTAVSVAIVAGEGEAHCTISDADRIVVSKVVSDGGLVVCFWAGNAGNPPAFRDR